MPRRSTTHGRPLRVKKTVKGDEITACRRESPMFSMLGPVKHSQGQQSRTIPPHRRWSKPQRCCGVPIVHLNPMQLQTQTHSAQTRRAFTEISGLKFKTGGNIVQQSPFPLLVRVLTSKSENVILHAKRTDQRQRHHSSRGNNRIILLRYR